MQGSQLDPLESLVAWYQSLSTSQQIKIAVHLGVLEPSVETGLASDPAAAVVAHLRQPWSHYLQVLQRIGTFKMIVDVCICVAASRNDVEAFGQAAMAILVAKSQSQGDKTGEELGKLAYEQGSKVHRADGDLYLSWSELTEGDAAPLSAVSLYDWTFQHMNRPSPLSPS